MRGPDEAGFGGLADIAARLSVDGVIERDLESGKLGDVFVGDCVHSSPSIQLSRAKGRSVDTATTLGVRQMALRSMKRNALTSASRRLRLSAAGYFFSA